MPTTKPRTLRLGGLELTAVMDRTAAERLKATRLYRAIRHTPRPPRLHNDEPSVKGIRLEDIEWYHTIDLPNGVTTPGFVDHRAEVPLYKLPVSLAGKRCLDVATYDGFWAFELEKRGAAEVIGIDLFSRADCDFPTNLRDEYLRAQPNEVKGRGFAYAKRALGSKVQRRILSVYELSPERIGTFDFVFVSDLLLHLRDPLRALEAMRTVCHGDFMIAECIDPRLEQPDQPGLARFTFGLDEHSGWFWWQFSSSMLEMIINLARFEQVERVSELTLKFRNGAWPKLVFRAKGGPLGTR